MGFAPDEAHSNKVREVGQNIVIARCEARILGIEDAPFPFADALMLH